MEELAGIAGLAAAAWGLSKWLQRPDPQPECQEGVIWERPQPGWYKLNIDGSVWTQPRMRTGPATAGGLIRDHKGIWEFGFTAELPDCDSVSSELRAISHGLKLARDKGYEHNLEVETDFEGAVRLINNPERFADKHKYGSILRECRELLEQLGVGIKDLRAVKRSQNECADRLTKVPLPPGKMVHVWDEVGDLPPTHRKNFNDVYMDDINKSAQPGTYRLAY